MNELIALFIVLFIIKIYTSYKKAKLLLAAFGGIDNIKGGWLSLGHISIKEELTDLQKIYLETVWNCKKHYITRNFECNNHNNLPYIIFAIMVKRGMTKRLKEKE